MLDKVKKLNMDDMNAFQAALSKGDGREELQALESPQEPSAGARLCRCTAGKVERSTTLTACNTSSNNDKGPTYNGIRGFLIVGHRGLTARSMKPATGH